MSTTAPAAADPVGPGGDDLPPPPAPSAARGAGARGVWARVALACAVLLAAGALRAWQGRRVEATMLRGRQSPFELNTLPEVLGPWRMEKDARLDPAIARGAGSTDNVTRVYVDERTGVRLEVIILYGPAAAIRIHAPQVCYPAAGFSQAGGAERRVIEVGRVDGPPVKAAFDAMTFTKGEGGRAERRQVYYAWRYNDRWTPDVLNPKEFQRVPGMYKVHVDRRAAEKEVVDEDNPCESFLRALLAEFERRLAGGAPAAPSKPGQPA